MSRPNTQPNDVTNAVSASATSDARAHARARAGNAFVVIELLTSTTLLLWPSSSSAIPRLILGACEQLKQRRERRVEHDGADGERKPIAHPRDVAPASITRVSKLRGVSKNDQTLRARWMRTSSTRARRAMRRAWP